jgi:hypothetical protein
MAHLGNCRTAARMTLPEAFNQPLKLHLGGVINEG